MSQRLSLEDRVAMNIGNLVLQLEKKNVQLEDIMAKNEELEKTNAELEKKNAELLSQ